MTERLELEDIQGLFARGFGQLTAARYVLLEIEDARSAAAWLRGVADRVTTGQERPTERAVNVALTARGMAKLGLPPDVLGGFANELVSGMTTPHRQRILGDVEASAPEHWRWGGPATPVVDALLVLFAVDRRELAALDESLLEGAAAVGLRALDRLETSDLDAVEHFGFRDGISQPPVDGLPRAQGPDAVRAGEFVLGYRNEYGRYATRPMVEGGAAGLLARDPEGSGRGDLGKNGSYLVFRQLEQDVLAFWRFVDGAAHAHEAGADASAGPGGDVWAARTRLASKMVGRWPSGAPLALAPDADDPSLVDENDFGYHDADPHGYGCPIGAHVRRANPRDSLDPDPGTERSLAVNKRHRLLRRGREYGPPLLLDDALNPVDPAALEAKRGLYFICLNASIARQFEFVQSTWLNNPKFGGLYEDSDPLVSGHRRAGGTFTIPERPVRRRVTGLPQFVTVRGGGYFFLPGVRALRYLASLLE